MPAQRNFSLVLGGGGLKGLAHIGVLQALEEAGLRPSGVVGSSIGSLIAAAWAAGRSVDFMRDRALAPEAPGRLPGSPHRHGVQADALAGRLPARTAG